MPLEACALASRAISRQQQFADFPDEGVAALVWAAPQFRGFQAIPGTLLGEALTVAVATATVEGKKMGGFDGHRRTASPYFMGEIEEPSLFLLKIRLIAVIAE